MHTRDSAAGWGFIGALCNLRGGVINRLLRLLILFFLFDIARVKGFYFWFYFVVVNLIRGDL